MQSSGSRAANLLVTAILAVCITTSLASAQTSPPKVDPLHPFAGLKSVEEWKKKFVPGTPNIDPGDRYNNLTSGDFWRGTWKGQSQDGKFAQVKGSGGMGIVIRSPYPFKSAEEHYKAWLAAADGGTKKTRETLPDWSGDFLGVAEGVLHDNAKLTEVMDAVAPDHRPQFEQLLRAEQAGRHWWPAEFCLPDGFGRFYSLDNASMHFMMDQSMVLIDKDRPNGESRYVYTDGRGFLPPDQQFPQWYGASQGFWDGDELVIWTSQIKQWVMTHGLPEYSDQLEAIERVKRIGDEIVIDITLYDPVAFAYPWHDVAVFKKLQDWTLYPTSWAECASTNNVYMDADGKLRERRANDPQFRDFSDLRPWATAFDHAEAVEAAKTKQPNGAK